jgi:hypothetical protein
VLDVGAEGVAIADDEYAQWARVSYRVSASRGADGAIALHCPSCASPDATGHVPPSQTNATILGADGATPLPSVLRGPFTRDDGRVVVVPLDVCLRQGTAQRATRCAIAANVELVASASDVVEMKRRVRPEPAIGIFALGASAILVGAAALITFVAPRDEWPERAGVTGLVFGVPSAVLLASGIWALVASPREETLRPEELPH